MKEFEAQRIAAPAQWMRIYRLYRKSFPRCERKPFRMIISMWGKGKTDVWCYRRSGQFAGFATTINAGDLILLDYLAVSPRLRGRGTGTMILASLKEEYGAKGLFVEIESMYEDVPDREERRRRRLFYERSGFIPMGVMADVFDVRMELLGVNCRLSFEDYHNFYRVNYSEYAADHILEAEYPAR